MTRLTFAASTIALLLAVACGDDSASTTPADTQQGADTSCAVGEYYDPLSEQCVISATDDTGTSEDTAQTTEDTSAAMEDTSVADTEADLPPDTGIEPGCDEDGDGVLSMACGGDDCDDDDFRRSPLREESCDEIDNDCNDAINDGVDCSFFAHTGDSLYKVDPFGKWAQQVSEVPNLFDIDTHPDGTLYGITGTELYFFDEPRRRWYPIGEFPTIEQGTGFAIDSEGTAFITAADSVYIVDLVTASTSFVGELGSGFFSSGDCVINKRDSLYMTSKDFDMPDTLILIDRATGRGQEVGVINGFSKIYGLTSGWGNLYGLSTSGELIVIDPTTAEATLLHTFTDYRWYGAASTPSR